MPDEPTIGLDYTHNNNLTLEAPSYADFTEFLFSSGYKLGKIQAGFDSLEKLNTYDVILLSTPKNTNLDPKEIKLLEEYIKNGGSLLIVSSSGGDHINSTNLNELTTNFGFEFVSDEVNDSMSYVNFQKRPVITKLKPHILTEEIRKIVFSSACSIKVLDFVKEDKNIKIEEIANGGLNCWTRTFDGEEWVENDNPKIPLMVAVEYYEGKVVGFGNLSMFSSLGREYGFSAFDNSMIIANILKWLTVDAYSEGKAITVNLILELYHWIQSVMKEDNWDSISDLINISLKYFKDNYKDIVQEIKKMQKERVKKRKEFEEAKKKDKKKKKGDSIEEKIIEMVPVRKKEDLEDIMSALGSITGEKYEIEIDLDAMEEEEIEEALKKIEDIEEQKEKETKKKGTETKKKEKGSSVPEHTEKDIQDFEKAHNKHAIWRGKPTNAFKLWLKVKKTDNI